MKRVLVPAIILTIFAFALAAEAQKNDDNRKNEVGFTIGGELIPMTREDIQLLYEYDRWANNKVLQAASALSAEAFTRDLGGSFCSVRDTLVHIIGGEWIWLAYWRTPPHSPAELTNLRTRRDELFNPHAFPNIAAIRVKWSEIAKEQTEFVDQVTNELLGRL